MNAWLLTLSLAYLLGSIPFGFLLVRFFRKEDIRRSGSGNIGATNVARSGAKGLGVATLVLDAVKAFAAVVIAQHVARGNEELAVLAALAAILGHMFPVWLRFHGGKGVASALGVYLALCWPAALLSLAFFVLVAVFTRYVSLGSILGAAVLPLFFVWLVHDRSPAVVGTVILISLLVIFKHRENIARLMSGTERRFGREKKGLPPAGESA